VVPRVQEGLQLAADPDITAATDISDGLAKSIFEMTASTDYGIRVENIPLTDGATEEDALYGGEDYELLFTSRKKVDYPFACYVGRVVNQENATDYPLEGFDHFSQ
jgi:thiamine-monophosphate kinase